MRSFRRFPWHVFVILAAIFLVRAGSNALHGQAKKAIRLDALGDPLPEGVLARLGTQRFVHLGDLASVAISPDGKIVASGVSQGMQVNLNKKEMLDLKEFTFGGDWVTHATIRLWDVDTGKLIREIITPDAPVSTMKFDSTGRWLYAGCGRYLCSWNVATGRKAWERQQEISDRETFPPDPGVESILPMKDAILSLQPSAHQKKTIRYWEPKSGKPLPVPATLASTVLGKSVTSVVIHDVSFSLNGKYAAVLASQAPRGGSEWKYKNRCLQVIELDTGTVAYSLSDEKAEISAFAFSDEANALAVVASANLWLVQVRTGQKKLLAKDLPALVYILAFVDGKHLTVLPNRLSRAWDIRTGKQIDEYPFREHHFAPTNKGKIAAYFNGNTIRLVERKSGKPLHFFDGHRLTPLVRYAIDSPNVLLSRDADHVYRWDTRAWKVKEHFVLPDDFPGFRSVRETRITDMDKTFSVERGLQVMKARKGLDLRDLKTGRLIRPLEKSAHLNAWWVFAPKGNRLATRDDFLITLFDVDTGKRLSSIPPGINDRLGLLQTELFSPHGNLFARRSGSAEIEIFDPASGLPLQRLVATGDEKDQKSRTIASFRFSNDEQLFLGEVHQTIQSEPEVAVMLWDLKSGRPIQKIASWPARPAKSLRTSIAHDVSALSPDHRLLALAKTDAPTIEIWDIASASKRGELVGHAGPIADLAFSPDGKQLASSSDDTTILIWDMNRPLQPATFLKRLTEEALANHWKTLFEPDAQKADTAIWSLVHAAGDNVPFLKKRLQPVKHPDEKHVQGLLASLGDPNFKTRSGAEAELQSLGELVLPTLEKAFKQNHPLETHRRLEGVLKKARAASLPFATPQRVGQWRALEVLERIGNAEATQLVRELANGAPEARLTIAAKSVLARMH